MTEVNIIGLGFVGLTTAVGLSFKNIKINAVETNISKLNKISSGKLPFYEPILDKKAKAELSAPPDTATKKLSLVLRVFSNLS